MTLYDLKPRFQQLLKPPTDWLYRHRVTANQVTSIAAIGSVGIGGWLAAAPDIRVFLILPVFLFMRMALNAIDGMLARDYQMQSPLGTILNEVCDVISDSALYLPFALLTEVNGVWVVLVVLFSIIGEFVSVLGSVIGASRRNDGPLGKSDRAFVFSLLGLLIGLEAPIGPFLDTIFQILCALTLLTIINRGRRALREVSP